MLSATGGGIFIASFVTISGAPVGKSSESFSLAFSLSTGIIKIFWKKNRK